MTWGALAQSALPATTLTAVYTVPVGVNGTVEVVICNRGAAGLVRLSHAVDGEADATKQYLLYDYAVNSGETKVTVRFTVSADDVIRAYASTADFSVTVNGITETI